MMREKIMKTLTSVYLIPLFFIAPIVGAQIGYFVVDRDMYEGHAIRSWAEYTIYQNYQWDKKGFSLKNPLQYVRVHKVKDQDKSSLKEKSEYQVVIEPFSKEDKKVNKVNSNMLEKMNLGTKAINRSEVIKVLDKASIDNRESNLREWAIFALMDQKMALKEIDSYIGFLGIDIKKKDNQYTLKVYEYVREYKKDKEDKEDFSVKEVSVLEKSYTEEEMKQNGLVYLL